MADEHEEWTPYQKMEAGILKDISCDTDRLIEMMEGNKMGEGFDTGALMGMLANKGVDPGIVAMLNDRCRDGEWGGQGGIWIVLLFLFLLGIGGGNGFFGNRNGFDGVAGVDRTVVNEANYSRLLDAVGTNGTRQEMAIQSLAQTLNCDVNSIKSALCSIDKELAVNQGSIVNAIQSCCCNISNQIQSTSCATQRAIENQGSQTRELLQDNRFLIQSTSAAQNNLIQGLFCQQNQLITDKFNALELRDLQRDLDNKNAMINDLKFQLSQEQQTTALLTAIRGMNDITFSGTAGATVINGTGTIS